MTEFAVYLPADLTLDSLCSTESFFMFGAMQIDLFIISSNWGNLIDNVLPSVLVENDMGQHIGVLLWECLIVQYTCIEFPVLPQAMRSCC